MTDVREAAVGDRRLEELGVRLRKLRHLRGHSLNDVAQAVGVSPSFLSMLERGRTDISLGRITRLADFYAISLGELLLEGSADPIPPDIETVVEQRTIDRGPGVTYRLIRRDPPQVVHVVLEPFSGFTDVSAHHGEDFWILLRNRANLLYGDSRYPMEAMQTARFSGTTLHAFDNPYSEPAELVGVTTVPYW
jgi:transcriptional regulator with XRE-family HTH domain